MVAFAFLLSLAFGLSASSTPTVLHFEKVPSDRLPRAVVERDFCEREEEHCWQNFKRQAEIWAGDINGDGIVELLVAPGAGWEGSAGKWYFLYQKRGKEWVSLTKEHIADEEDGNWITLHPRFDILPIVRSGYHDLRVTADMCMKWNGKKYDFYDPVDYHALDPDWFNDRDSHDAQIFWAIRHAGTDKIAFVPMWFPLAENDFIPSGRSPIPEPGTVATELDDPQEKLRWYGLLKGGIWAVRGKQTFFLAPQVSETFENIVELEIEGDWLLGFGGDRPSVRYNRRTHELILDRHDYDDSSEK